MLAPFLLLFSAGSGVTPSTGLPTVQDLKDYLRIETTAEDTLLGSLLDRAVAMIEGWIDLPITAEEQTAVDRAEYSADRVPRSLVFPQRPIGGTVTVVDADGDTVDATTYTVDTPAGMIWGNRGVYFDNGPYTITASAGLSLWPRYSRMVPMISELIIDIAADLYQRRTPSAASETGAGTSITWDVSRECSGRAMKTLKLLKLPVIV